MRSRRIGICEFLGSWAFLLVLSALLVSCSRLLLFVVHLRRMPFTTPIPQPSLVVSLVFHSPRSFHWVFHHWFASLSPTNSSFASSFTRPTKSTHFALSVYLSSIRFSPPLVIEEEDLLKAIETIKQSLIDLDQVRSFVSFERA